jgi:uncharacterized membrane protein YphA (DoxX/SURF4 family)
MANTLPRWLTSRLHPVELLLRLAVGGLFVYAALPKLADPLSFSDKVRNFRIIDDPWVAWAAMGLPVLELAVGLCLLLRVLYPGALAAIVAMLVAFIPALASLIVRGIEEDCGCLSAKLTPDLQILVDALLLGITIVLILMWRKEQRVLGSSEA